MHFQRFCGTKRKISVEWDEKEQGIQTTPNSCKFAAAC